jgi:hypothetical protein
MKPASSPNPILLPLDAPATSNVVLAEAMSLTRATGAKLVVMHVVQPPPVTDADAGAQMSAEYAAMASESLRFCRRVYF